MIGARLLDSLAVNDTLNFYTTKPNNIVNIKTLVNPVPGPNESLGHSSLFSITPSIVHFGGLKVGELHEQVISIVNISPVSQRLSIYPASSGDFFADYEKQGSLAPGMSQKIVIRFRPKEYKYYHDYIKIQTIGQQFILIPIHAYPVVNKLEFPRNILFGQTPLCEPSTKSFVLRCSIPVDFSFDLEVIKPHPYFRIDPISGIIPANGEIVINVTFSPITLGSCFLSMRLHVGQFGWVPMDCDVSAKSVSGLLESRELKQAELRLMNYLKATGEVINSRLNPGSGSSFRGDLTFNAEADVNIGDRLGRTMLLQPSGSKNHFQDPTAALLASTFKSSDLNAALDVLQQPALLSTKVNTNSESATGIRGIDGVLKSTLPVKPRGVGSGIVFDAGAQWMTLKQQKTQNARISTGTQSGGLVPRKFEDTLVEGLRIPPNLDTFPAVNFVYTQEPGKLKPKDLKVAIERSRAERELRAEEQKKIREEGGGAGMLDLRGILAEERLNLDEGDPFKRQLREMAFLADVDDVEKQEAEKQFRISEEFMGSLQLSDTDIDLVYHQRDQALRHKQRATWRESLGRQHTLAYPPSDQRVKAGASAAVAKQAALTLKPSFDTNRNDIWAKRMNTLRRLMSLVSKWLVRNRLNRRMGKVKNFFQGVATKEEAKELIALENASAKAAGASSSTSNDKSSAINKSADDALEQRFSSVTDMVCSAPNDILIRRQNSDKIIASNRFEFTANMARRVLFPKFVTEEASTRSEIKPVSIDCAPAFDDRTFFQLKSRPEFVSMGYTPFKLPPTALTFSPANGTAVRDGAAEEAVLRPAADLIFKNADLRANLPPEPPAIAQLRVSALEPEAECDEGSIVAPAWLTAQPTYGPKDLDFFQTRPEYRVYMQPPSRSEKDEDWELRPYSEILTYDEDTSLRSLWLRTPGFLSVNTYLLAGHATRNVDPPKAAGPTISDFYMPDLDRHLSGMVSFASDHLRALMEDDPDIAPPQVGQDKADVLTDSESDDDDGYVIERPSIMRARRIFRNASSLQTAEDGFPSALDRSFESDGFGMLSPTKKREEQVELLRDRKMLDLESTLLRLRQDNEKTIFQKLRKISEASTCVASALQVQAPFHTYEDELVSEGIMERLLPPLPSSFVQHSLIHDGPMSPNQSTTLAGSFLLGSPGKF